MPIQLFDEETKAKERLINVLNQLAAITPESLTRAQELGTTLSFNEGRPIFERTMRLFLDLQKANLDNVPLGTLNNLYARAQAALASFKQIQEFNPGPQANPAAVRDGLIQRFASEFEQHYQVITPVLSYSIRKGTDFENLEKTARNIVNGIQKAAQDEKDQADKHLAEITDTLEKVRRAAAEVGVAQHATHFKLQANEHLKHSKAWLWVTAVLAFITLVAGVLMALNLILNIGSMTNAQSVQLVVAKLIIFSILYSATIWSGRIYKSQWHNYVINKHRQNALSTFETFVMAAADSQTKDSVLLQATRSIFSCQPSGFVTSGDLPETPQILEIIRGLSSTKNQE